MECSQHRKLYTSIGEIYLQLAIIDNWVSLLGIDAKEQLIADYLHSVVVVLRTKAGVFVII
jgi:hypothetical protein